MMFVQYLETCWLACFFLHRWCDYDRWRFEAAHWGAHTKRLKFRCFNLKVRSFGSIALLLVLAASLCFGLVVLGLARRTLVLVAALRVGSEQFLAGFNVLFGV